MRKYFMTSLWVVDAIAFVIPPWHKHDWLVAFLFMCLALYESGIWQPSSSTVK